MTKRSIRFAAVTSTLLLASANVALADDAPPTPPPPTPPADATAPVAPPAPTPSTPEPPYAATAPQPEPPRNSASEMTIPTPGPVAAQTDSQPVAGKWKTSLYGFVQFDTIGDTTQGFNDLVGNAAISRPNTYAGDHGQLTYGARNSRIGFKIAAPEYHDVKASGMLEMDFLGNQPTGISDASFYNNPGFRVRHMNVKLETPVVDLLFGQYWELFGWQSAFHPATVEIQGVPGQIYSRAPQIRVSKTFKSEDVNVELAIAALRPPQRDSATPDGQAGARILFNKWTGQRTAGATATSIDAASIGVSGVVRHFAVDEFAAAPSSQVTKNGWGVSLDAMLPIVPATKQHHDNALTLTANYVRGAGIADLYTSLSGGVGNAALPNPTMATPAPTYTSNVDGGLVEFTADGVLHAVDWQSILVGLQYYLPESTHLWVTANVSHMSSDNAKDFGAAAKIFDHSTWGDGNLFFDATPAVRFGLEYARFNQTYADMVKATDNRVQFSAFFIF
jgi:hypothetical protein